MSWKEFLGLHTVAADYKEGADGHVETMPMVSVENAEKACSMAQKELATELLKEEYLFDLFFKLEKIRDEKI